MLCFRFFLDILKPVIILRKQKWENLKIYKQKEREWKSWMWSNPRSPLLLVEVVLVAQSKNIYKNKVKATENIQTLLCWCEHCKSIWHLMDSRNPTLMHSWNFNFFCNSWPFFTHCKQHHSSLLDINQNQPLIKAKYFSLPHLRS